MIMDDTSDKFPDMFPAQVIEVFYRSHVFLMTSINRMKKATPTGQPIFHSKFEFINARKN
jgi:hypothetical protein